MFLLLMVDTDPSRQSSGVQASVEHTLSYIAPRLADQSPERLAAVAARTLKVAEELSYGASITTFIPQLVLKIMREKAQPLFRRPPSKFIEFSLPAPRPAPVSDQQALTRALMISPVASIF